MKKREITKFRNDYTPWVHGCVSEGLMLAVTFDEKDEVKRRGARWNPDPSGQGGYWWMPASKCTPDMLDWLNHMQMVYGHYGTIDPSKALESVAESTPATYALGGEEGEMTVRHYADCKLVSVGQSDQSGHTWFNEEDGRNHWNSLVASGFYRLSEVSA